MRKKIAVFALMAVMAGGVAVGCGNKGAEQEKESLNVSFDDNSVSDSQSDKADESESKPERSIPEDAANIKGIEKLKEAVDYSDKDNWLSLPEKCDKDVDVIFLYPTSYGTLTNPEDDISDIDDMPMRIAASFAAAMQASVFEEDCNVYVPYYRQLTVPSLLELIENSPETLQYIADLDIYPMLDYYFEQFNEGRPFILAGHSQGSVWLTVILEDYMKEHPEYYENMIAAYVIGYSVTEEYLAANPHLKFAEGAEDTGVIVSYNTEGKGNKDQYNCVVREGAIAINPINWKRDESYASVSENLGSLNLKGEIVMDYADARLDTGRGVVVCESIEADNLLTEALRPYFGTESYHMSDYSLYFMNLQKNVADRIKAFEAKDSR